MSISTLIDEVMIVERASVPPLHHKDMPPSARTDLELVSTFVAKAYIHDVKLTALPMPS